MPTRIQYYICTIVCLSLISCKEDGRRQTAMQIVTEWTGKGIRFPTGIPCQSFGKDTICIDPNNPTPYKVLLYVDSLGCSSCRLKLPEWKTIIAEADSLLPEAIDFLFYFQPKKRDEKELQLIFRQNGFRYPVFIDTNNAIERLNKFPSQTEYQCFLLDRENKVLLVGNPTHNSGIWALIKRIVLERDSKLTYGKREESIAQSKQLALSPAFPPK